MARDGPGHGRRCADTLFAAQIDSGSDDVECDGGLSELIPDSQSFKLGEIGKEPGPKAGHRLTADMTDEVQRAEVVPVEFLIIWARLLGHVDGRPDRGDFHDVAEGACDPDREHFRVATP
jgi:hypothetical protein